MAPEQARGEAVDHRADLFSLGSVLYALCTGRPPFRGSTAVAVVHKVSEDEPLAIRAVNPDVPVWLEAIVTRLLAKDPANRFQSAGEVADLLERSLAHLVQPLTVPAPAITPPPAGKRPGPGKKSRQGISSTALGRVGLLLLAAFGLVSLLQILAPGQPEQPFQEVYQDFRQGQDLQPPLRLFGVEAAKVTTMEKRGLRITLPVTRRDTNRVGIELRDRIKGNFEATVSYEILLGNQPERGHGVGVELFVATDTPTQEDLGLFRMARVQEGQVYKFTRSRVQDGERKYGGDDTPATCKSGRLRITRLGTAARMSAAEGDADDFRELWVEELGAEDVNLVRVAAFPGHAPNALDLLVKDLRVRTLGPGEAIAQTAPAPSPPTAPPRVWLLVAGLIGLVILVVGLGGWLVRRRNRPADRRSANAAELGGPEAATGVISFPCSGCGKPLKARAVLAGKKVKCPKCSTAVGVPSLRTAPD
jgi:hypothetical protein